MCIRDSLQLASDERLDAPDNRGLTVGEGVDDDDVVPRRDQSNDGVRADVPGPPAHENSHAPRVCRPVTSRRCLRPGSPGRATGGGTAYRLCQCLGRLSTIRRALPTERSMPPGSRTSMIAVVPTRFLI